MGEDMQLRAYFLALVTRRRVSRSTLTVSRTEIRFLYEVTLQRTWPVLPSCARRSAIRCRWCCRPTRCSRYYAPGFGIRPCAGIASSLATSAAKLRGCARRAPSLGEHGGIVMMRRYGDSPRVDSSTDDPPN